MPRKPPSAIAQRITAALEQQGPCVGGPAKQRYLKATRPCLGTPQPVVRRIVREALRAEPPADEQALFIAAESLYAGQWHEQRHAAVELVRAAQGLLTADAWPHLQAMIVEGAWWDTVDTIAKNIVGPLLRRYPQLQAPVFALAHADNLWLRRTALLCQVGAGDALQRDALTKIVLACVGDEDFFIRKAIGWALRDAARHDPAFVREFLAVHGDRLAPLSRREATRHL